MRCLWTAVPTPRGWSRPRKRTTNQGRFLTPPEDSPASQLRAQRRIRTGFPLNRPRPALAPKEQEPVGGTLIAPGC